MKAKTGLIAALLASAGLSVAAPPAAAQGTPRALDLSREERAALTALQGTLAGGNRAAQDSALAAARAAARGAPGRYAVAHYQFQIGRGRGDMAMQTQAVDAMVESGLATPEELPGLLSFQAGRALGRRQCRADRPAARAPGPDAAEQSGGAGRLRPVHRQPADPVARPAAAERIRANAVALFQRALAANEAAGRPSPESWHLRALAIAYDGTRPPVANMTFAPAAIALARALVAAYPTPANWRDALLVYRELSTDPALALDIAPADAREPGARRRARLYGAGRDASRRRTWSARPRR